jgi:ABC-type sugar transport system ATPase subunit
VDAPLSGEIALDGRRLNIRSPQDAIREGIFLAPEDRRQSGLIVDFTVRENVTLPGLKRYATAGLVNSTQETAVAVEMCRKITSRRQVLMLLLQSEWRKSTESRSREVVGSGTKGLDLR